MEGDVAFGTGAGFKFAEYLLPEPSPLVAGMNTHGLLSRRYFWMA
jgi:hypothetical protein